MCHRPRTLDNEARLNHPSLNLRTLDLNLTSIIASRTEVLSHDISVVIYWRRPHYFAHELNPRQHMIAALAGHWGLWFSWTADWGAFVSISQTTAPKVSRDPILISFLKSLA